MIDRSLVLHDFEILGLQSGAITQLRRVLEPQPAIISKGVYPDWYNKTENLAFWLPDGRMTEERTWPCPFGKVGETLWVKERWATVASLDAYASTDINGRFLVWYVDTDVDSLTGCGDDKGKCRSRIGMPRWASRYSIKVSSVKVAQLKDMSELDCEAEGIEKKYIRLAVHNDLFAAYAERWDSIHSESRKYNPNLWTWVAQVSMVPKC